MIACWNYRFLKIKKTADVLMIQSVAIIFFCNYAAADYVNKFEVFRKWIAHKYNHVFKRNYHSSSFVCVKFKTNWLTYLCNRLRTLTMWAVWCVSLQAGCHGRQMWPMSTQLLRLWTQWLQVRRFLLRFQVVHCRVVCTC